MTDREPETAAFRKIRVQPSLPPSGDSDYRHTHVVIRGPDEDTTFDEAEEELDAWIARKQGTTEDTGSVMTRAQRS